MQIKILEDALRDNLDIIFGLLNAPSKSKVIGKKYRIHPICMPSPRKFVSDALSDALSDTP
ncbi:11214_t:CDS:2, partial [Rhizophagus irregularis]